MGQDETANHPETPLKTAREAVEAAADDPRPDETSDKARDLLRAGRLTARLRLGERMLRRVGGRMWDRPNLAVSERLYKRFQLDDPWAPPGTPERSSSIGLGPVSLRFGEKRRQPAPHLKPKEPKKKKLPGEVDPVAKYRRPQPTPKPAESSPPPSASPPTKPPASPAPARPATPPGPTGKYAITGSSGEFGGTKKRGLVGKLPVRPDLQAPDGAKAGSTRAGSPPVRRAPAPAPARPNLPKAAPPKSSAGASNTSRPQPRARPASSGGGGVPLPRPKLPAQKKRRAGRFRMSPTEVRSPVVTKILPPEPEVRQTDDAAPVLEPGAPVRKKKVAPEKPIDRSIPTGPMGLDDLFGAMDGGRMRVGRRKKKEEPESSE